MKKITMLLAAAAACLMLAGCSGKTDDADNTNTPAQTEEQLSCAEKTQKLMESVETPEMVEVTSDRLMMYFKIDESTVTEFSAYICGSGAMPDEFGVFVFADADSAAAAKTSLEARIAKQRDTFTDYTPDEVYKLDNSFAKISGNTVSYAICADNDLAAEIFG